MYGIQQSINDFTEFMRYLQTIIAVSLWDITKIVCNLDLGFHLHQRSVGDVQESNKLLAGSPPMSFSDVGRNCDRCSPDLAGQSVHFVAGPRFSNPVNDYDEIHSSLPRNKITIAGYRHKQYCTTLRLYLSRFLISLFLNLNLLLELAASKHKLALKHNIT